MIGILMLNTRFPRLHGDVGNPASFKNEVLYETVSAASVDNVVVAGTPDDHLVADFVSAGNRLIEQGATTIGTSCGFLSSVQQKISDQLSVPFLSSSLVLLPFLKTVFGYDTHIGVLTFDKDKLGQCHFPDPIKINHPTISITGLQPPSHWYQCISRDLTEADSALARKDVLDLTTRCLEDNPQTGLLLLECTNLSPWKQEIRQQSRLPVFDLLDALQWLDRPVM